MKILVDHKLLKRLLHHMNYWRAHNHSAYTVLAEQARKELEDELATKSWTNDGGAQGPSHPGGNAA